MPPYYERERDEELDSDADCEPVSYATCRVAVREHARKFGTPDVLRISFAPCEGIAAEVGCFRGCSYGGRNGGLFHAILPEMEEEFANANPKRCVLADLPYCACANAPPSEAKFTDGSAPWGSLLAPPPLGLGLLREVELIGPELCRLGTHAELPGGDGKRGRPVSVADGGGQHGDVHVEAWFEGGGAEPDGQPRRTELGPRVGHLVLEAQLQRALLVRGRAGTKGRRFVIPHGEQLHCRPVPSADVSRDRLGGQPDAPRCAGHLDVTSAQPEELHLDRGCDELQAKGARCGGTESGARAADGREGDAPST